MINRNRILAAVSALVLLLSAIPALGMTARAEYNMPYYIEVDLTNQIVTVFSTGTNVVVRQMLCSTGLNGATPKGTYYMPPKEEQLEREEWYYFRSFSCYAHYASRIYKNVLFHSIPCSRKRDSSISKTALEAFGRPASHGCVRLRWQDAEFIAKCCDIGTRVRIYESKKRNEDLRELLFASSYTNEKGQSYKTYLGIPEEEGVLGRNSEGKEVVSLQTRLRDLGFYNDEIDGLYRGSTINAVRQAQQQMDVTDTGMADTDFVEKLLDDEMAPTAMNVTLEEGMSGPVVRNMQQYLAQLKLYDGAIDGVFDVDVTEAVKKFQGAYGYPTDGVLMPEIQQALYYEAGRVEATFSQNEGYVCEMEPSRVDLARVSSNVTVRLRKKPSASADSLTKLSNGDLVLALQREGEWSRIQHGKDVGYMNDRYLQFYSIDAWQLRYTATDSDLSYVIGNTQQGYEAGAGIPAETFEDYLASGGSLEDYEGITTYARVTTQSDDIRLNLREAPNTSSAILGELPNATVVEVLLQSSEWSLVQWNDVSGYLLNEYLQFWEGPSDTEPEEPIEEDEVQRTNVELPAMVVAMDGERAPVYDVDSDDGNVLGNLKNGTQLTVLESVGGWSRISYEGHTGYMKDEDLQFMVSDHMVT